MTKISKIHDKFYKDAMSDLRIAKDFFSVHLPEKIKQLVDLDSLKQEKADFITQPNFVTGGNEEKVVDMLYSVKISGKAGYFYNLAEHQSTQRKDMPLRLMRYMLEIIAYDVKKQKKKGVKESDIEYPIIVPVILYNGQSAYSYSTNFFDMYTEEHRELAREIMTNSFQLIDLNYIKDEQLRGHVWASILEFAMQSNTNKFRNDIELILKKLVNKLVEIESERDGDILIDSVLCYTLRVADMRGNNPRECLETITKEFSKKNRGKIMAMADRLEETGRKEGREEGREEGQEQIIINMIKQNVDIENIHEYTGWSIDSIEKIKKLKVKNQQDF